MTFCVTGAQNIKTEQNMEVLSEFLLNRFGNEFHILIILRNGFLRNGILFT